MSENENVEVVRRWVDLLGRWGEDPGDVVRVMELIDPACEWVLMATGERYSGHEAITMIGQKSCRRMGSQDRSTVTVADFSSGRGGFRTPDRWCVKPELYH